MLAGVYHAPYPNRYRPPFDTFAKQWFYGTVVPEYHVEDSELGREAGGWVVRARIKNVGSGVMPIRTTMANPWGRLFWKSEPK